MKKAFTLIELLVVISLLVIIAIVVLIALNPWGQINKSNDSKRKHELTQLSKVFEDYYNDKNCYPKPNEVCYNSSGSTTCNICGSESTSPSFSPYLSHLPCDPQQPNKKYLYQVDSTSCPTWYRIYGTLSNATDPAITEVGCQSGCGTSPNFIYNYGVSSPNIGLEINNNLCSLASKLYINPNCNICGDYSTCKKDFPNQVYYTDPGSCIKTCIKD
jgi:type II secretory pathway pseudopilin PulG